MFIKPQFEEDPCWIVCTLFKIVPVQPPLMLFFFDSSKCPQANACSFLQTNSTGKSRCVALSSLKLQPHTARSDSSCESMLLIQINSDGWPSISPKIMPVFGMIRLEVSQNTFWDSKPPEEPWTENGWKIGRHLAEQRWSFNSRSSRRIRMARKPLIILAASIEPGRHIPTYNQC